MLDLKLKNTGTLTMSADEITIKGFDANDAMCREVSALALIWAIGELQKELDQMISQAGGSGKLSIDG